MGAAWHLVAVISRDESADNCCVCLVCSRLNWSTPFIPITWNTKESAVIKIVLETQQPQKRIFRTRPEARRMLSAFGWFCLTYIFLWIWC